jgi:hypothetical protein
MIRYDLVCKKGHAFDGWFSDSSAFDRQSKAGAVACPHCGSAEIAKQLMTPQIGLKANRRNEPRAATFTKSPDPKAQKLLKLMREVREHVEKNSEYVGDRFAEEARRIHYKEAEERGIYGEATTADAAALIEEGLDVHPLPRLPEDSN